MKSLILLLAASTLFAQQATQPAKEEPKRARLEGVVLSSTGGPVPRAAVTLLRRQYIENGQVQPPVTYTATSGDDGKYAIENIEPGVWYTLGSQKAGFAPGKYGAKSANGPQASFSITLGQELKGLTLTMMPQSVVTGKVTNSDGDPVHNANVILARRVYQRGGWQLVAGSNALTNDLGEFRLANIMPGRYTLVASEQAGVTDGNALERGKKASVPTFFPNAVALSGAAFFDVTAGQDLAGIEMRIRQTEVFNVRGKISGRAGVTGQILMRVVPKTETNSNMVVQPSVLMQMRLQQIRVTEDNSFEFRNLLPGSYIAQIAAPPRSLGSFEFTVTDEDIPDFVVPVREPVTVTGSVRLEGGDLQKLLPNYDANTAQNSAQSAVAAMFSEALSSGARVAVGFVEAVPVPSPLRSPAAVLADGTFTAENLVPGRYQMSLASLPEGTYVKSVRYGGSDVTAKQIDISSGGQIDVVLANRAASVAGVVVDEKGESPAAIAVCLWPETPDLMMVNQGTRVLIADQNGRFDIRGLRPGVYYAVAFEDIEWGIAREQPYLNLLKPDASRFDLKESARESARIKIIPVATLKKAEEKLQ
jgi:hypothetical protein